eukprot:TRINITY_DN11213_c0_g1_i1.p1 TRINITY_DN11213_c0_g1~~TRINITY_DN11213_c0_g1_i1.p1  ORF type:complete len:224 (-),score=45.50 TRINITY_DN11213_c0_g1_i1:111-782(-)
MASDPTILKKLAARLEVQVMDVLNAQGKVPDVVTGPILERLDSLTQDIYQLIGDAAKGTAAAVEKPSDANLQSLQKLESKLGELVESHKKELDKGDGPWHDPAALRKLKEIEEAMARELIELKKLRRQMLGQFQNDEGSANGGYPQKTASSSGGGMGMPVEKALGMLLDNKAQSYRGGLVGIIHAAGVQEMTPITSHSPGKFEFIFAPKTQAAWSLHQYSTMI